MSFNFVAAVERVTGRKARGAQMEEIGCKCKTFFLSLLIGRRKQTTSVKFFSPSLYNIDLDSILSQFELFSPTS